MVAAAELTVLFGALIVALGLIFLPNSKKAVGAFIGAVLVIAGAGFGGLAWAGIPGFIDLDPVVVPDADSLWEATILTSSDTDRTEAAETLSADSHTISYTLTDANMDGLGDLNLDVRVTNKNIGPSDKPWAFSASLVSVTSVAAANYIVNRTGVGGLGERFDVSYTLTESGAPTLSQTGETATSGDWFTGASDQLNVDFAMSVTGCQSITTTLPGKIVFMVGGISMTVDLLE